MPQQPIELVEYGPARLAALTAAAAFAAAWAHSLVAVAAFLFLGGMAAASSNSASARVVVGWFPPERRGLVMGIRQTAQPLGVGLGALVIPRVAQSHGVSTALLFPAVVCAAAAVVVAVGLLDPPRPPREQAHPDELANPYRGTSTLWRIHAVSVLLVVPLGPMITVVLPSGISRSRLSRTVWPLKVFVSERISIMHPSARRSHRGPFSGERGAETSP